MNLEALLAADRALFLQVHRGLHEMHSGVLDALLRLANEFGNGWAALPLGLAVWCLGQDRPARRRRLVELGAVAALTPLIVGVLKDACGRWRPQGAVALGTLEGDLKLAFGELAHTRSFPSGHTAAAFALATLLAMWAYRARPGPRAHVAALAAGLFACLTGVARIYTAMHYPLDVFAGGLLGIALAFAVCRASRRVFEPAAPAGT